MGGKLHGRNMLISEYIFVICIAVLGSKEIFRIDNSNDSIEQMGRKQVSSHMQVVKKFFEDLRCCKNFIHESLGNCVDVANEAQSFKFIFCSLQRRRKNRDLLILMTITKTKSQSLSNRTLF